MRKAIVIFELDPDYKSAENKLWFYGYKKDTLALAEAIRALGWKAEIVFYKPEIIDQIYYYVAIRFDAYISRVNLDYISEEAEEYLSFLKKLTVRDGILGFDTKERILAFERAAAFSALAGTEILPQDTYVYYDIESLEENFTRTMTCGKRALTYTRDPDGKGNRGLGVRRVIVEFFDIIKIGERIEGEVLLRSTSVLTHMCDFYICEYFLKVAQEYYEGKGQAIIDTPFYPLYGEGGQIRVLLVGKKPVGVVVKKRYFLDDEPPLVARYTYTFSTPDEWPELMDILERTIPVMLERLEVKETPLLWGAHFLLSGKTLEEKKYVLIELNCSRVNFSKFLNCGIQELVAQEVINRIERIKGRNEPITLS